MIEFLQNVDLQLFYWINHSWSNGFFDKLMPFITETDSWILVYLVGFYVLFFKTGKTGRIAGLALILTIIATDQFNSSVLKELFGRLRPCHTLPDVNLLVGCGGGKSMPSSHAANNFAAATVIVYYFRKNYAIFYSVAVLVALSRVYVGVHYPSDIMVGAFVGTSIGLSISYLVSKGFILIPLKYREIVKKNKG
jgi:undecaprenyl-diphosphatase